MVFSAVYITIFRFSTTLTGAFTAYLVVSGISSNKRNGFAEDSKSKQI